MTTALSDAIRSQWESLPGWPIAVVKEATDTNDSHTDPLLVPFVSNANPHLHTFSLERKPGKTRRDMIIEGAAHVFVTQLEDMESEVWASLKFPIMKDREDAIADAELKTFDWIFKEPRSTDRPWGNLLE